MTRIGLSSTRCARPRPTISPRRCARSRRFGYAGVELFDLHGHDPQTVAGWLSEIGLVAIARHALLGTIESELRELAEEARRWAGSGW